MTEEEKEILREAQEVIKKIIEEVKGECRANIEAINSGLDREQFVYFQKRFAENVESIEEKPDPEDMMEGEEWIPYSSQIKHMKKLPRLGFLVHAFRRTFASSETFFPKEKYYELFDKFFQSE